jgi:chromosome segregation ATPase
MSDPQHEVDSDNEANPVLQGRKNLVASMTSTADSKADDLVNDFDQDVVAISTTMESMLASTQQATLELVDNLRVHMGEEHLNRIRAQRRSYEGKLDGAKAVVSEINKEMDKNQATLDHGMAVRDNMLRRWRIKQHQLQNNMMLCRTFMSWVQQVKKAKAQRAVDARWVIPYSRRRQHTKIFTAWRTAAMEKRRKTDELFWQSSMKEMSHKLVDSYENALTQMRSHLDRLEKEVKTVREDGNILEEKMKQAFMRGVCALNREAMAVFTTSDYKSHVSAKSAAEPNGTLRSHGDLGMSLGKPLYTPEELSSAMASCVSSANFYDSHDQAHEEQS